MSVSAAPTQKRPSRAQSTLMRALKFNEHDLEANRAGTMSDAQRERLGPAQFSSLVFAVIGIHAVLIVGILGAIAIMTGETALWIVMFAVLGLGLVPFVLMRNEGNLRPAVKNDVSQGKVAQVEGMATLEIKKGRYTYYELSLGATTFRISSKAYGAFRQGEAYRAYYLPTSETLLTAEPLSNT